MWIKDKRESQERLYNGDLMDAPVEFTTNYTAQVPKDVGEKLVEETDRYAKHGEEVEETVDVASDDEEVEEVVAESDEKSGSESSSDE